MVIIAITIIVGTILLIFGATAFTGAPYVPTHRKELELLFKDLYVPKPDDLLLDIGSGDGCVLAEFCKQGGRAIGYEINPFLVVISRIRLRKYASFASVQLKNFWRTDIPSDVSVVYVFGESRDIAKMFKKIEHESMRLNKELYFISYGFTVPGVEVVTSLRAHHLYKITPLHHKKP